MIQTPALLLLTIVTLDINLKISLSLGFLINKMLINISTAECYHENWT